MNICPKCQMSNVEYFVAGYCPQCATKVIDKLQVENDQLKRQLDLLTTFVVLNEPELWEAYLKALKEIG